MIQDIQPRVFSNTYKEKEPTLDAYALVYEDNKILLRECDGNVCLPTLKDLGYKTIPDMTSDDNEEDFLHLRYAFSISEQDCFLVESINKQSITDNLQYHDLQMMRTLQPMWMAFVGITGSQLHRFYKKNSFCGICGSKTDHSLTERAMVCSHCHDIKYPSLSPAVIVGVTNGNQLLMTKYAQRANTNYALVAGFAELGETLEQCVAREVMEEVGVEVTNIRYYKSQPWAFSDSLLMGFFAELN